MRLRTLTREDVDAALALLREGWPYDRFRRALVDEKLFDDPPGETSVTFGLFGSDDLDAFLSVVARGETAWLKLGAIGRGARKRGGLTQLLEESESWARAGGAKTIRLMDHPGNYWTPGLDIRYAEALEAFGRLGYAYAGENRNLTVSTRPRGKAPKPPQGVELRRARAADRDALLELAATFHPAWSWEVGRALANRPAAVHVAVARERVVAFAAHDGNNRGGGAFGPAATISAWRGKGIGELLMRACLIDIARQGRRTSVIPWVGSTALYDRLGAKESGRFRVVVKSL